MEDLKQAIRINYDYKLKAVSARTINGVPAFYIENRFIPVETLVVNKPYNWGTINGRSLNYTNLIQVFDVKENISMLAQNMQALDLSEFLVENGVFIPEPSLVVDLATQDYVLFYLEKLD